MDWIYQQILALCCLYLVSCSTAGHHQQVIGFLHLSFTPRLLRVHQGEEVRGQVNFTVPDASYLEDTLLHLHVCCVDEKVAIIMEREHTFVAEITQQTTIFPISIYGHQIGRTILKFYVSKNKTDMLGNTIDSSINVGAVKLKPDVEEIAFDKPAKEEEDNIWVPAGIITSVVSTTEVTQKTVAPLITSKTLPPKPGHIIHTGTLTKATTTTTTATTTASTTPTTTTTPKPRKKARTKKPDKDDDVFYDNPIFQDFYDEDSYYEMLPPQRKVVLNHTRSKRRSGEPLMTKDEYEAYQKVKEHQQEQEEMGMTAPDPNIWWLPEQYEIIVHTDPREEADIMQYILIILVLIVVGLCAGQTDLDEVIYLLQKPLIILVAAMAKFIVMPALTIGLVELLHPTRFSSLGMLAMSCAASDGAAVLILQLIEADLTLGLTLTITNNTLAIAMLPLWSVIFQHFMYPHPNYVSIPFTEMFFTNLSMALFMAAGLFLQRKKPKVYNKIWQFVLIPSAIAILLLAIMELYRNYFVLPIVTGTTFIMAAMLATGGFIFGASMAFIARLPSSRILVIAIETGTHSSFLTCILLVSSLEQPEADMAKAGPTVWSFLTLAPALFAAIIVRFYKRYNVRKYANTECTDLDNVSLMGEEQIMLEAKETAM